MWGLAVPSLWAGVEDAFQVHPGPEGTASLDLSVREHPRHTSQGVCKARLVLHPDPPVPRALLDRLPQGRASPHHSLALPTEGTAPLPLSCSLVSLVSHLWAPCPLALPHQAMVRPLAHLHHSKAHPLLARSLHAPLVLLVHLWPWPHLTCVALLLEARPQLPMSTRPSSLHLETTTCRRQTEVLPQTTHTGARLRMTEITVLEGIWMPLVFL